MPQQISTYQPPPNQQSQTYEKPYKGEKGTYLPHDVSRLSGIVPYVPAESNVYEEAYTEFIHGDYTCTGGCFDNHRRLSVRSDIIVKCQQACASCKCHRPVGIPSEYIFNYRVACSSRQKNNQTHIFIINKNTGRNRVSFWLISSLSQPAFYRSLHRHLPTAAVICSGYHSLTGLLIRIILKQSDDFSCCEKQHSIYKVYESLRKHILQNILPHAAEGHGIGCKICPQIYHR